MSQVYAHRICMYVLTKGKLHHSEENLVQGKPPIQLPLLIRCWLASEDLLFCYCVLLTHNPGFTVTFHTCVDYDHTHPHYLSCPLPPPLLLSVPVCDTVSFTRLAYRSSGKQRLRPGSPLSSSLCLLTLSFPYSHTDGQQI